MQTITLNQPITNASNNLNTNSNLPVTVTENNNTTASNDVCGNDTVCNELIYSIGAVVDIGPPPECEDTSESFQRSLTSPTQRRIGGGKSSNIIIDLSPGEVHTLNPASLGLTKLTLLQIKATCGDIAVSFDCDNWFNVKLLLLDSFSPVNCDQSSSHIPIVRLKNYYPSEGLVTCNNERIKKARVEVILLGS